MRFWEVNSQSWIEIEAGFEPRSWSLQLYFQLILSWSLRKTQEFSRRKTDRSFSLLSRRAVGTTEAGCFVVMKTTYAFVFCLFSVVWFFSELRIELRTLWMLSSLSLSPSPRHHIVGITSAAHSLLSLPEHRYGPRPTQARSHPLAFCEAHFPS